MKTKLAGLLLAAALVITGCSDAKSDATSTNESGSFPAVVQTSGGDVTVPARPTKIISLGPTLTEMLYAIDAGSQVIAVDQLSNYPTGVPTSDLSGFTPNVEAIAAKSPDLVVVTDDMNNVVAGLNALKIPTLRLSAAKTLDDTYNQINALGKATGHIDEAKKVVEKMKDDIADITEKAAKRPSQTYFYELDNTYYTVTSQSFVGSVLAQANMKNIADEGNAANPYPQLSAETIVKANPDVIVLADTKCCGQSLATVSQRPGWSGLKAVQSGKVVALDDDIASRWGPRIVDLYRQVTEATAVS